MFKHNLVYSSIWTRNWIITTEYVSFFISTHRVIVYYNFHIQSALQSRNCDIDMENLVLIFNHSVNYLEIAMKCRNHLCSVNDIIKCALKKPWLCHLLQFYTAILRNYVFGNTLHSYIHTVRKDASSSLQRHTLI